MLNIIIGDIQKINIKLYKEYLLSLNNSMRENVLKYKFKKDKYRTLLGKVILIDYLKNNSDVLISDIKIDKYNKPYIENSNISFSISHSENYTIVLISDKKNSIGIDIEKIDNNIELQMFKDIFTKTEYKDIKISPNQIKSFYKIWTIKEAVLKAYGTGFLTNPKKVLIENNNAYIEDKIYNISTKKMDNYIISIAYENSDKFNLINFNF